MSHTFKLILVLPVIIVYVRRKLPVPYNTGISYPGDGQNYIRNDSKAGKKRLKGRKEKTQRQPRKDLLKGSHEKTQRQARKD
jgi:hypothetical protein